MRYIVLILAMSLPTGAAAQTPLKSDIIEPQFANAAELKSYVKKVISDVATCSESRNGYLSCYANDDALSFQLTEQYEPKQGVVGLAFGVSNNIRNQRAHFDEAQFAPAVRKYIVPFLVSLKLSPEIVEACTNFATLEETHGARAASGSLDFALSCKALDQNSVFGLSYSIIAFEK